MMLNNTDNDNKITISLDADKLNQYDFEWIGIENSPVGDRLLDLHLINFGLNNKTRQINMIFFESANKPIDDFITWLHLDIRILYLYLEKIDYGNRGNNKTLTINKMIMDKVIQSDMGQPANVSALGIIFDNSSKYLDMVTTKEVKNMSLIKTYEIIFDYDNIETNLI